MLLRDVKPICSVHLSHKFCYTHYLDMAMIQAYIVRNRPACIVLDSNELDFAQRSSESFIPSWPLNK